MFRTLVMLLGAAAAASAQDYKTWSDYAGAADSAQYTALTQINKDNVKNLRVAWTYPTGDNRKYFFGPLMANGKLFVLAKNNSIVALDAATGKEIWTYAPTPAFVQITTRGINYWQSKDGRERRLFFCGNHSLRALDADTGKPIATFGKDGAVDLREGLDRDPKTLTVLQSLSPGRVFEDLIIEGTATNQGYGSAPGDIRAFDVRTGRLVWTFHTVPRPGEFGYDTWPPDAWKTVGGANVWSNFSIDEKRGIVYASTASPKYNFYGADRHGADLFGDCMLALEARTGKRLWHFQMVHHDLWDYDGATEPKLLTVRHNGKPVDVVVQFGKQGFVWVFDRVTGRPLWPIEERPVPKSDMAHEWTSPTQPFPTAPPPFSRQKFTVDDLSPYLTPEDRARFRDALQTARNEGLFTPPSTRGTVQMPGNNGGANWGGATVDPLHGKVYLISKDLPAILKLERDPAAPQGVERYVSGFNLVTDSHGLSPIKPPYTTLTAYDLNDGAISWKMPLGDTPGHPGTGVEYPKIGPVLTATGLIFTGARDKKVRAIEAATGKLVWETTVPTAIEGIPAVYELAGRQYIVFCAAAQAGLTRATEEKIEGAYIAFALPK